MASVPSPLEDSAGTASNIHNSNKRQQKHPLPEDDDNDKSWDDHRSYMRVKKRKLDEQFQRMGDKQQSSIFEGVTIYVNGWTDPNADELKHMIHAHGGSYEFNLYSNAKVTHTIATNLPNSKITKLGDSIVCTPNWIVDSVAAGSKLPVDNYRLYSNRNVGQKVLNCLKSTPQQKNGGKKEAEGQCVTSPTERYFKQYRNARNVSRSDRGQSSAKSEYAVPLEPKGEPSGQSTSRILEHQSTPRSPRKPKSLDKVSEFFTHSRLHYLSTWSTELKQFTAKMLTKVHPKYPKLSPTFSLRSQWKRAVVHIDLDCFFVSVSIRNQPQLKGKPVAVTHAKISSHKEPPDGNVTSLEVPSVCKPLPSKSLLESTSDIASCSYEARECGLRNGMSVGAALKLCPDLILLPYDFDSYRCVSQKLYETLLLYSSMVEAVSCDEAYIELTDFVDSFERVQTIVEEIRTEVQQKTGCTVSAGISHNMLLARMSTRVAKPDGQFYLPVEQVDAFMSSQKVHDLPGVGYSMKMKLKELSIETCGDLKEVSLVKLQGEFGAKTGKMLHCYCRGIDTRELRLSLERKSVSVDMNFGIRFTGISEAKSLIERLAEELERRAEDAGVVGGTVTLKMKKRCQDAPNETWKYLGHGACDNVTRSVTLLEPTRNASEIGRLAVNLMNQVNPPACDIRGMGLQLSKLVSTTAENQSLHSVHGVDIRKMFSSTAKASSTRNIIAESPGPSKQSPPIVQTDTQQVCSSSSISQLVPTQGDTSFFLPGDSANESFLVDLPPPSQLDSSVLKALPFSLQGKILRSYSGKSCSKPEETFQTVSSPVEVIPARIFSAQDLPLVVCDTESVSSIDNEECTDVTVIDNETKFMQNTSLYISHWISNSFDGPIDSDLEKFANFLSMLLQNNLMVVSLVLKYFRATILKLNAVLWCASFDQLLDSIQNEVEQLYSGRLLISNIA